MMLAVVLVLLLLVGGVDGFINEAQAQSGSGYDLAWWTVDGGGGQLSGSGFLLNDTTGQPDASSLTDGGF